MRISTFTLLPLLLTVLMCSCSSPLMHQPESQGEEDDLATGKFQIESIRARVYQDEALTTLVEADKARIDFRERAAQMQDVSLRVMENDAVQTLLESEEGVMFMADNPEKNIAKGDVILRGGVQMQHGIMSFEFPEMRYHSADLDNTFVSHGGAFEFELTTEKGTIVSSGRQMKADRALSKFSMIGPGEIKNREPQP